MQWRLWQLVTCDADTAVNSVMQSTNALDVALVTAEVIFGVLLAAVLLALHRLLSGNGRERWDLLLRLRHAVSTRSRDTTTNSDSVSVRTVVGDINTSS
ncbi:MAG: hypothetical protein GY771_07115 [bacterium]|nr:hypothetical protein [bacterium]